MSGIASPPVKPGGDGLLVYYRHMRVVRLDASTVETFKEKVYRHYREKGRTFPWRDTHNPYHILISEVMLQQTQTARVVQRYSSFIDRFPDFAALATAPAHNVLAEWQGLGYNRRAMALLATARSVVSRHGGRLPREPGHLLALPGIGPYTASAIRAFAFDEPDVLIETNIRTVFIHEFFDSIERVDDSAIAPIVDATLDRSCPRTWYYALMDYGAMLKKTGANAAQQSTRYRRQGAFEGSTRQARSIILRALVTGGAAGRPELALRTPDWSERYEHALRALCREGLVVPDGGLLRIAE